MKGNIKIGIATLLVLLMALATAGTASASETIYGNGALSLKFMEEKSATGQTIEYNYGDTIKVECTYDGGSDTTNYLDLKDRANNNDRLERY
ncbi:MAG: hypothetical protein ACLFVX_04040, partial [Archaeoglobaceae archaeon]